MLNYACSHGNGKGIQWDPLSENRRNWVKRPEVHSELGPHSLRAASGGEMSPHRVPQHWEYCWQYRCSQLVTPKPIPLLTFHPLSIFFHISCEIPEHSVYPTSASPQRVLGSWHLLCVQLPLTGMFSHNDLSKIHLFWVVRRGNCKSQSPCVRRPFVLCPSILSAIL